MKKQEFYDHKKPRKRMDQGSDIMRLKALRHCSASLLDNANVPMMQLHYWIWSLRKSLTPIHTK